MLNEAAESRAPERRKGQQHWENLAKNPAFPRPRARRRERRWSSQRLGAGAKLESGWGHSGGDGIRGPAQSLLETPQGIQRQEGR